MEERARLKALEALFDPTTTARIVALPAAGEVVIAVEASPVSQYDLMMISGNDGYRRYLPAIMGTEGVGRAATSSVVISSLFIILADVVLVRFILVFFP